MILTSHSTLHRDLLQTGAGKINVLYGASVWGRISLSAKSPAQAALQLTLSFPLSVNAASCRHHLHHHHLPNLCSNSLPVTATKGSLSWGYSHLSSIFSPFKHSGWRGKSTNSITVFFSNLIFRCFENVALRRSDKMDLGWGVTQLGYKFLFSPLAHRHFNFSPEDLTWRKSILIFSSLTFFSLHPPPPPIRTVMLLPNCCSLWFLTIMAHVMGWPLLL